VTESPAGRVVHVGHKPEGMALDPKTGLLAVALKGPDRLALLDAGSGRVLRRVALPGAARHLALMRPGGPVLVPAEDSNRLVEVDLPGGRTRSVATGRNPHDAAAASGRTWVGDELQDEVTVVRDGRVVKTLAAPVQPGGVAATDDGRKVGVVGVRERALRIYDARGLRPLGRVAVGIGPTHVVGVDRRLFVVDTRGDALLELRVRGTAVAVHRRTQLGGTPYGIAYDPERRRFWVTLTASNRVAELTDRRLVRTFPTVRQPNSVAVDPRTGRVFVASRTDGTLQLLDPPSP
jgi:DNA-binding beta-propeller fold protein YncE